MTAPDDVVVKYADDVSENSIMSVSLLHNAPLPDTEQQLTWVMTVLRCEQDWPDNTTHLALCLPWSHVLGTSLIFTCSSDSTIQMNSG